MFSLKISFLLIYRIQEERITSILYFCLFIDNFQIESNAYETLMNTNERLHIFDGDVSSGRDQLLTNATTGPGDEDMRS